MEKFWLWVEETVRRRPEVGGAGGSESCDNHRLVEKTAGFEGLTRDRMQAGRAEATEVFDQRN